MKFRVTVIRRGYAEREIIVEAKSAEEAEEIAIDNAGDYDFDEHSSEYDVDYVEELNEIEESKG